MNPVVVTGENFEVEVLQSEKPVLADFWADWCGPCKMLSPVVDQVAGETEEVKVVKINVDENEELAMRFKIMSIPALVVFKDGQEVNRSVGVIPKEQILELIK